MMFGTPALRVQLTGRDVGALSRMVRTETERSRAGADGTDEIQQCLREGVDVAVNEIDKPAVVGLQKFVVDVQ